MANCDAERVSPMTDDASELTQVRRPTRVPSIKIEPPCEIDDFEETSCSSCLPTALAATANYNALSPSMSPGQRAMVDLKNQPGNYKKNLTARFLQQGHSEDDGYYRSDPDADMVQPEEKRSKSLDRGLEWDPSEVPLDLTTSLCKSSNDLRNKFEARARKMHHRNRAESEENLPHALEVNTAEHMIAMRRLSHSDMQLNHLQQSQPSRQSTPSGSLAESDSVPPSVDMQNSPSSTATSHSPRSFMPLPPISMMYNRGTSSSSTDGSLDMDRGSPYNFLPGSSIPMNPAIAANLYGHLAEPSALSPIPGMNLTSFNMAAFLEWHQMQNANRVNQTLVNQCFICKQTFPGFDNMAKHIAKHLPTEVKTDNNNRVHMCKVCNRSFSRSDMLTRHMRLHTGLKPYECKECGQVFSRSDHLNTHKRTHTGEKPYQCPKCPYAACRRDMITRHMRIHTNKDATKKRRRLGMLYCKDSVSGSSVESTDSTPSRGGSLSGNSFDSSFESSDLRWTPRHLLDPSDLLRNQTGRTNWSASNSFDSSDYSRNRNGAWSSLTSGDSTESDGYHHAASFDGEYMSTTTTKAPASSSAAVFSMPTTQLISPDRSMSGFGAKNRRPSLVRQDASLDQDTNKLAYGKSSVPFSDYKTKLEYRNSGDGKSMDCSDDIDIAGMDKDSVGTADSPRTVESPLPAQESGFSSAVPQRLNTSFLPKQASLGDELNLQKCALNE